MDAALRVEKNPPAGTSGFLEAGINGNFNFALTPDLKPIAVSGETRLDVSSAGGVFDDFSAFSAGAGLRRDTRGNQASWTCIFKKAARRWANCPSAVRWTWRKWKADCRWNCRALTGGC